MPNSRLWVFACLSATAAHKVSSCQPSFNVTQYGKFVPLGKKRGHSQILLWVVRSPAYFSQSYCWERQACERWGLWVASMSAWLSLVDQVVSSKTGFWQTTWPSFIWKGHMVALRGNSDWERANVSSSLLRQTTDMVSLSGTNSMSEPKGKAIRFCQKCTVFIILFTFQFYQRKDGVLMSFPVAVIKTA